MNSGHLKFFGIVLLLFLPLIGVVSVMVAQAQITPNDEFFVVSKSGTPIIDADKWQLTIEGQVENEASYSYAELKELPSEEIIAELQCVEGYSGTAEWRGVPLRDLLEKAKLSPEAEEIVFRCADDFSTSLTLEEALEDGVILAYEMNGETLPRDQGYPLRLVAPNQMGYKWAMWIVNIYVVDYDYEGYWETRGWNDDATRVSTNEWSFHAIFFSISFILGGIALMSGYKFSKHEEYFHDLPKFVNRKFHVIFSLSYYLLSIASFSYWVFQTLMNRGDVFYTLHGILSLGVIGLMLTGLIHSILRGKTRKRTKEDEEKKKKTERGRPKPSMHLRINLYSFVFFILTLLLGFMIVAGSGYSTLFRFR